jgi:hypothetical protein
MKRSVLTACLSLAILSFTTLTTADVLDPLDNGAAPPGLFALVTYFGQTSIPDVTDENGDKHKFGLEASSMVIRPVYFIGQIKEKLTYGVNAIIPVVSLSLDSNNAFGAPSSNEFGIGDIGVSPFIFLYENQESQVFLSFWEFVFAPTGEYHSDDAVNIGRDAWWFQHQLAFGWYPNQFGIDANINYFQFTKSDELNYDEPDALELEAVAHYALTDKFRVGINAAYWFGVENAKDDGTTIHDSKPKNFKLGLNLMYTLSENLAVNFRWMHDIDSENSTMGDTGYIKIAYVF